MIKTTLTAIGSHTPVEHEEFATWNKEQT